MAERRIKPPVNLEYSAEEIEGMKINQLVELLSELIYKLTDPNDPTSLAPELKKYRRNILTMPANELRDAINHVKTLSSKEAAKDN